MGQPDGGMQTQTAGMLDCLPVATPVGWRAAGSVRARDLVWCLGRHPQQVVAVQRLGGHPGWAVHVPQRALGNPQSVLLLPGQPVALDLEQAAALHGHPLALVPAHVLLGWRGIGVCRLPAQSVVRLQFAQPQIVQAGPGLLLSCATVSKVSLNAKPPPALPLTADQARHLMACVMAQDIGAALRLSGPIRPYAAF